MESTIIRGLAVVALGAAVLAAGYIAFNSGVIGGRQTSSPAAATSPAAPASAASGAASAGAAASADVPAASGSGDAGSAGSGDSGSGDTPSSDKTYTVQEGDSFYSIARKYNTSIADIQKLNPNVDPQHLSAGITLKVP